MELAAIIGIGLALSVDASATAFSCGISAKTHGFSCPLKLAATTAFFQGAMPLIGFFAAENVVSLIAELSRWVAFAVFIVLGILFIRNALRKGAETGKTEQDYKPCECKKCVIHSWKGLFAVGMATSLDALAVGVGIACAGSPAGTPALSLSDAIFVPAGIFALITFVCVLAAFGLSYVFRRFPTKILGVIAGLILLALGIRVGFF